jgi:hypothetical protein
MAINPTATQAENDQAALGHTVVSKVADGSAADPNTPPWLQGAPANVALPVVSGSAVVGSTLQCSTGAWNYSGLAYSYQWQRAAAPISGATSKSYTVVTADKTNALSCKVTATSSKGSASATSAATAAVP